MLCPRGAQWRSTPHRAKKRISSTLVLNLTIQRRSKPSPLRKRPLQPRNGPLILRVRILHITHDVLIDLIPFRRLPQFMSSHHVVHSLFKLDMELIGRRVWILECSDVHGAPGAFRDLDLDVDAWWLVSA